MEANRKMRKGFIKGKLVGSLYRATQPYSNKSKPGNYGAPFFVNQADQPVKYPQAPKQKISTTSSTTTSSVGIIVNREKVNPQPKPKVSFMIPAAESKLYGMFDNPYGVVGDEGVDAKAASYISCVQERFKLERINSERQRATLDSQ